MSQPPPPPPIPGVKSSQPVKGGTEAVQDELLLLFELLKATQYGPQVKITTDNATQQLAWLQAEIARHKEEIDRLKIEKQLWESDATTHARDNVNLRLENAYLSDRLAKLQQ